MERRLAAIMATDVVGYSRLIRADEEGTIAALKALRADLIDPKIAEHHGRIVKLMGDGMLAEFASVVDAVRAAVETQVAVAEHNSGLPEDKYIEFRVGINLGDVVIDGDDIHGDGVNVAARLEGLSEPGGICISGKVYEEVRDRTDLAFEDLGEQEVKNIDRSVRVWRWITDAGVMASVSAKTDESLPLPDKPSIAVLAFDNMSGDPEQEYFSDGMTEDIITALSRLRWLFVIARNSTFTYKGQAVDVKQVGREMGVRYVLEGSVRKAGQRVRVTAQLVEAETGNHIWAERYDRELDDIFDLQDELTEAISAQVDAELAGSERQQAHKKTTTNLDAWELYQRGMWHFYKFNKGDMAEARRLFQLASERAPEFANAYAGLATVAYNEAVLGYTQNRAATLEQGLRDAETAVALDDRDGYSHYALGRVCTHLGESESAISALEKSVDLNPSFALAYYGLGFAHHWFGRAEEAIPLCARAIRLSPHDPQLWTFHQMQNWAHSMLGDFDVAILDAKAAIQAKSDEFWPHVSLASTYSMSGRNDEARVAFDRAIKINPRLSAAYITSLIGTLHPPYLEKILDALRQVGMPEE